ncbi:MAG: HAD family hydrolase [Alphaproteobacteria bacterium]|jgi:phosphoglycolate phosphatase
MYLTKPKAIIFDWDNTLVDSWHKLHFAINSTLEAMQMEAWSLDEVKARMHHSSRDFFPRVFGPKADDAKNHFYSVYRAKFANMVDPLDNARDTLELLRDQNIKATVLSNKKGDILRNEVKIANWVHYFQLIVGATDCAEDKPSPVPVHHILQHIQVEPGDHIWFVGDTIVDMECANNTGCRPILFGEQIDLAAHPDDFDIAHHHVLDHKRLIEMILSS